MSCEGSKNLGSKHGFAYSLTSLHSGASEADMTKIGNERKDAMDKRRAQSDDYLGT